MFSSMDEFEKCADYLIKIRNESLRTHFPHSGLSFIRRYIEEVIEPEYEETKKSNTKFGKLLQDFDISLYEFITLFQVLEAEDSKSFFFQGSDIEEIFEKNKIKFDKSKLKSNKLIFQMIDPMNPRRKNYEVSYKVKLLLEGREYTDEYKQLDFKLEEDSKRNSLENMDGLYYAIKPEYKLKDLIAYPETIDKLNSAIAREQSREKIFNSWNLKSVMSYGRGLTLNFRGPPGTGKTMSAHALANELGKKILIVRYDQLQSAFVGESEKNIANVFKMAKIKNSVLFFDEADAIALSRENLERSWEMSQVNTLLKELENFEGVCIFATNYAEKYDKAFERRLTMHIDFKNPDKEMAQKILKNMLPKKARGKDVDLDSFNVDGMNGGHIKNIILNASGFAASDNSDKIMQKHLSKAIEAVTKGSSDWDKSYVM